MVRMLPGGAHFFLGGIMTLHQFWAHAQESRDRIEAIGTAYAHERIPRIQEAYQAQDSTRLIAELNKLWWRLPETKQIRTHPGFVPLCDLASCIFTHVYNPDREAKFSNALMK